MEERISVRALVEFILRSGDIDERFQSAADTDAMAEGGRIHRKIQGGMQGGYRAEVPLSIQVPLLSEEEKDETELLLTVEGRADGIFPDDGWVPGSDASPMDEAGKKKKAKSRRKKQDKIIPLVLPDSDVWQEEMPAFYIDEIKGVYRQVERMREPVGVHLAQAKCYAYIYARQKNLLSVGIQMTYCNLETEEIRRFRLYYRTETLAAWFEALTGEYAKWAWFSVKWKSRRGETARSLVFPYTWREGQKEAASDVYRTILRKKILFLQAPTGTGKTLCTVFPAVKAIGEGLADRIFYMTAKTLTRTVAEESFRLLKENGLRMKVLTLTAKEKVCPLEKKECNPEACPYAKGHFDRINRALFETLQEEDTLDRETIRLQAEKWMVCPFEFALDLSLWSDAVICDYNYVFDPRAKLKRFFGEGVKGDYLFLIDEAHNLVDRGREMFSAGLYREDFTKTAKAIRPYSAKAARAMERCGKYMLEMRRTEAEAEDLIDVRTGCRMWDQISVLQVHLTNLYVVMEGFMDEIRAARRQAVRENNGDDEWNGPEISPLAGLWKTEAFQEAYEQMLDLYFRVSDFLEIGDRLDDNYRIYSEITDDGRFFVCLYCIDISGNLQETLNKGKSTIFFSATLLPVQYYKNLLTTEKDSYAVYAKSVFDPENRIILIGRDTSSRFTRRGAGEYLKISSYIRQMITAQPGNYMVFFPSYRMLEDIADVFRQNQEEDPFPVRILLQQPGMDEREREEFLDAFSGGTGESLVGFCVMGGIFGEGIDLREDRLIGTAIVGPGLPQVCNEREILKIFYDARGEDGFFYAYLCPGMNKVLQSAGRVIRTDQDRGVILLLDERFADLRYRKMFPAEWEKVTYSSLARVGEQLRSFWETKAPADND